MWKKAERFLSKDKYIYTPTLRILATVFHMEMIEYGMNPNPAVPETIQEVIDILIDELPLKDKTKIAKMEEDDLIYLHPTLGAYIRDQYLRNGNTPLIMSCIQKSGKEVMDEDGASMTIIHALWEHLIETHKLRVVK